VNALGNKNESIHQFIVENEYARLRAKQKPALNFDITTEMQVITSQDDSPVTLDDLIKEETALLDEKNQLIKTKQELKGRMHDQIEDKKTRIGQLEAEILQIKQECKTLANALQISTTI
jgi:hypothetical protein